MLDRWDRVLLVIVAVSSGLLGVWAAFSPRSFYTDFPGFGHHWVIADGPYNEHLIRDVGDANLGLAFVAVVAVVRRSATLALVAAGAAAIAWMPHLVYHVRHADVWDTTDKVASLTALAVSVVVPVVLGVRLARRGAVDRTPEVRPLT